MSIGTLIKTIQDIMRKDVGVDGDAQRISQIVWLLFLKIFDDKEQEWQLTILDDTDKPWGRGQDSHLSIELLFCKEEWIGEWFRRKTASAGAEIIEFSGDKVKFANEIVPALDAVHFEPFRPIFEFIKSKCVGGVAP